MSNLRIKIEIHKGVRGVPLDKLTQIVGDVQRFLSMLSEDVGLGVRAESWIGLDFANGSLAFIAEKAEPATTSEVEEFNAAFVSIAEKRPLARLRRGTIAQYAKIADPIEAEEVVSFGLFKPPSDDEEMDEPAEEGGEYARHRPPAPLRQLQLTRSEAEAIQSEIQANVRAYGALQGRIHSLFLGSKPAYFNLRELSTGTLIKCVYKPAVYPEIASALQRRNAVLHVYGYTSTDLVERKLEEMEVAKVALAPTVTEDDFELLFGSHSRFTGKLTTQEFIDYARDRGHHP